ncbi:MAG: hypothetical protein AAGI03_10385 [Pseudomonadota bacterium]
METREFSASVAKTLPVFLALAVTALASAGGTILFWDDALVSGALIAVTALLGLGVVILGYRLMVRPVMLRVGPDGIYLKRLGVTLPWVAIGRIERLTWHGETLFELVEAETQHPIFDERALLLGAAMNEKLGLPPLVVQMAQYTGTPDDFEAAVRAASGRVIDRRD